MAYKNPEDKKEYQKKYREKNKEKIRLKNEKLYKFHKNQGLCTNCGKKPPFENLTQCEDCKDRHKILTKKRVQKGLCGRCGKPSLKGKVQIKTVKKEKEKKKRVYVMDVAILLSRIEADVRNVF